MSKSSYAIRAFKPADAPAFAALNRRWIEEIFGIEEEDQRLLGHPQREIIDRGGHIAVADSTGWVVGTGAILPAQHAPDDGRKWLEIIKMATDPAMQGRGIGSAIIADLLGFARDYGADGVWLETNDKLAAATHLYRKNGFEELTGEQIWRTPYERCNMQMTLLL